MSGALYFPEKNAWRTIAPVQAGFNPELLGDAIAYAERAETPWPRDLSAGLNADPNSNEPPPWNEVLGPTQARGGPNGLVIRSGRIVARWGDTQRVDMTFSVAKSYLAILAAVALKQGLIGDLDDKVKDYALDDGFDSARNAAITWRHFLHQTSEWEGALWDKPDLIDRNRQVGIGADNSRKGSHRDLQTPGTFYEYNDVRVNRFSLSLLQVFKRPLAEVLKDEIMDPIGASDSWRWHPYRNSWVEIDGVRMPSVPGGAHWGGGIFIHSEDHARFGLLVLNNGCWGERVLLPADWVGQLSTPSPRHSNYGYLWWLNSERALYPSAPQSSIFAMGAGTHLIWIEPEHELVAVMRWIDNSKADGFIERVMASLR